MPDLNNVPGDARVVRVEGRDWWLTYSVPNTTIQLAYRINDPEELAAIFGPDVAPTPDEDTTYQDFEAVYSGTSRELLNTSEHPWDAFLAEYRDRASIRPWLDDPQVQELFAQATLEGREVTPDDLATTDWWRDKTEQQRAWIGLAARDPATAQQQFDDSRLATRRAFEQSGWAGVEDEQVNSLSDALVRGDISEAEWQQGVRDLALPQSMANVERVRGLINEWVGPAVGKGWSDKEVKDWAHAFGVEDGAEDRLTELLRRQRLAAIPEWQDPNVRYTDIVPLARSAFLNEWGEAPDETDPLFLKVMRLGDADAMSEVLVREGLTREVDAVVDKRDRALLSAFGGP